MRYGGWWWFLWTPHNLCICTCTLRYLISVPHGIRVPHPRIANYSKSTTGIKSTAIQILITGTIAVLLHRIRSVEIYMYKRPTGQLRQSQYLNIVFSQMALQTLRALKVLAKKALFLSHLCSLKKAPIKKAERKNLVHVTF